MPRHLGVWAMKCRLQAPGLLVGRLYLLLWFPLPCMVPPHLGLSKYNLGLLKISEAELRGCSRENHDNIQNPISKP